MVGSGPGQFGSWAGSGRVLGRVWIGSGLGPPRGMPRGATCQLTWQLTWREGDKPSCSKVVDRQSTGGSRPGQVGDWAESSSGPPRFEPLCPQWHADVRNNGGINPLA
ncbi:hypothetical protein Tco_0260519 [Tanacetum coccineum]